MTIVMVGAILTYYERHGRYPRTLEEAGVRPVPRTPFGPYQLKADSLGTSCYIWVGDYSRNGFEYFWTSGQADTDWQIND